MCALECPRPKKITDTKPHMVGCRHPSNVYQASKLDWIRSKVSNPSPPNASQRLKIQWKINVTRASTTCHIENRASKSDLDLENSWQQDQEANCITDIHLCIQTDTTSFHEGFSPSISCVYLTTEQAEPNWRTTTARTWTFQVQQQGIMSSWGHFWFPATIQRPWIPCQPERVWCQVQLMGAKEQRGKLFWTANQFWL